MYHFHFNKGTVYLPTKKHENIPVIISGYDWDNNHWAKRTNEDLRDHAIKLIQGVGFVRMDMYQSMPHRWEKDFADMLAWVRVRNFANPGKVGIFAYGSPALAALKIANREENLAFIVATLTPDELSNADIVPLCPTLLLQGTTDKVTLQMGTPPPVKLTSHQDTGSKITRIVFNESDYFLYNASRQAAEEIVKWIKSIT